MKARIYVNGVMALSCDICCLAWFTNVGNIISVLHTSSRRTFCTSNEVKNVFVCCQQVCSQWMEGAGRVNYCHLLSRWNGQIFWVLESHSNWLWSYKNYLAPWPSHDQISAYVTAFQKSFHQKIRILLWYVEKRVKSIAFFSSPSTFRLRKDVSCK